MWYKDLKELRKLVGITATQMAERLGKDKSYISKLESGCVINTSFDTVYSMASIIAESNKIKNGEIDLNKYTSHFGKAVMSCIHDNVKEVYDFSINNVNYDKYATMCQYLDDNELTVLSTLAYYKKLVHQYNNVKNKLISIVTKSNNSSTLTEALSKFEAEYMRPKFELTIYMDELENLDFIGYFKNHIDYMESIIESIETSGIETILSSTEDEFYLGGDYDSDSEIIITDITE